MAELVNLTIVPCIVRELTDDEDIIIMVDNNLQRDQGLPSEKAIAYKLKLDAMKRTSYKWLCARRVAVTSNGGRAIPIVGQNVGRGCAVQFAFLKLPIAK